MSKLIDLETLRHRLDDGHATILVEALPERYYDDAHLPGAVRIDHERVAEQAPGLLPDSDAFIVVYCAGPTCRNSHQAAAALASLGYGEVHVFPGGKEAWEAAGLAFERARAA
jgi:rhodanese-related sulfurtransferase